MSRDVSLSPKSTEIRFTPLPEPINVEVVDEEQGSSNQLSFTATSSTSFIAPEELSASVDDLVSKKKLRSGKTVEELQRKRKDTTNSITNFFHRLTRGDREDKKIVEEEEEEHIGRPDKLMSPESEDKWFESSSVSGHIIGHEGDADIYEWDPNNMTETLVREPLHIEPSNAIFEEKGMLKLLEDFRSGELRWLDKPQIRAMAKVKEAHEDISNTHLRAYELKQEARNKKSDKDFFDESDDSDYEELVERLFEQMNAKMVDMHSALDTVPFYDAFQNRNAMDVANDDEYFSS